MKNVYGMSNWNLFENTLKIILLENTRAAVIPARGLNRFLPISIKSRMVNRPNINGINLSVMELSPKIKDEK